MNLPVTLKCFFLFFISLERALCIHIGGGSASTEPLQQPRTDQPIENHLRHLWQRESERNQSSLVLTNKAEIFFSHMRV